MSNSYLVIIKSRQLLTTSITKVILFNNIDLAYEYALNLNIANKEKVNTLDEVIKTNVVWKSIKSVFPIYECKIFPIDNDTICNIYQTLSENEKIIPYIFKELYINDIINE